MTQRQALDSGRALIGEDSERGFIARFGVLLVIVVVLIWSLSLLDLRGALAYAVAGAAAGVLALAFIRRPVEAMLCFAILVLFRDTLELVIGASVNQLDEMTVGLFLLIAFARVWRQWRSWLWLPRDIAVAAVVVIGVFSSLAADVPPDIWLMALVLLGKSIAFLYVVTWSRIRLWEIRAGMAVVFAVGTGVLGLAALELLSPGVFYQLFPLSPTAQRTDLPVIKSIFVRPVLFAWFVAFIALFAYAQFIVTRRWRWLAVAVLFSIGTFLSARRRAILALWAGLAAALLDSFRRLPSLRSLLRAWAPVGASAVLVAVVFMPGLAGLYQLTVETYGSDLPNIVSPGSSPRPQASPFPGMPHPPPVVVDEDPQARLALYRGSVDVARDYFPLGGGLGRYASWMTRVHYSPLYYEYGLSNIHGLRPSNPRFATDTFWPQVLGELGVFGLIAYAGFLGSLGFLLWRQSAKAGSVLLRVLTLGAGMVFVQALVESFASPMYHSPPRVYLLYLTVGAVASVAWRRRAESEANLNDS